MNFAFPWFLLTLSFFDLHVSRGIPKSFKYVLPSNYDKTLLPLPQDGPVVVNLSLYVLDFYDLSTLNQDVKVDMYFRQSWKDPRLAHSGGEVKCDHLCLDQMWQPDTFFASTRNGVLERLMVPNVYVSIKEDGTVLSSQRITTSLRCNTGLKPSSLDKFFCSFEIESYGRSAEEIQYRWKHDRAVGLTWNTAKEHFAILGHRVDTQEIALSTGTYSRALVDFEIRQHFSYISWKLYIPSAVFVILSWAPFLTRLTGVGALSVQIFITSVYLIFFTLVKVNCETGLSRLPIDFTGFDMYTLSGLGFILVSILMVAKSQQGTNQSPEDETCLTGYSCSLNISLISDVKATKCLILAYAAFNIVFCITFALRPWSLFTED